MSGSGRPSSSFLCRSRNGKRVFRSFDQPKAFLVAQRQESGFEILFTRGQMPVESIKTRRLFAKRIASGSDGLSPRLSHLSFRDKEFCHLTRMRLPGWGVKTPDLRLARPRRDATFSAICSKKRKILVFKQLKLCYGAPNRQSKGEITVSKDAVAQSCHPEASPTAVYPDHLEPELQATLSALACIETQYEQERDDLECWSGPDAIKQRLTRELEERHRHDREPYVQRLAELHTRIMSLTMFRGLRTMH